MPVPYPMMTYKNIIFDFDGTLADTMPLIIQNIETLFPQYSTTIPTEIKDLQNMSISEIIKRYKIPFYKVPFIINKVRNELTKHMKDVSLFPNMKYVLEQLKKKGIILGILSSNTENNIHQFLHHNNIDLFNFIHSELNIFGKDKTLINLIKKHNLLLKETMYVGDELRDIEACQKIGMDIIAVSWGFNSLPRLKSENPTFTVTKPIDILDLVS